MTLTLQLTPWALPALLALLLVAREWAFLLPRRRERGSASLLVLTGLGALWCLVRFLLLLTPDRSIQAPLLQAELVVAAVVPLAWLWFCLILARRSSLLRSLPAVGLMLLSLATVTLALRGSEATLLLEALETRAGRGGYQELVLAPGPWYWVHLLVRGTAILWGAVVATRHLSGGSAGRLRTLVPGSAALAALLPIAPQLGVEAFLVSRDVSPAAVTVVATLMVWSLMRQSLLKVGPVAHTLVMEKLQDPLVVLDARGRIVDVNRRAENLLGLQPYGDVPLTLGTLWASVRERAGRYARVTLPVNDDEGIPAEDEEDPRPRRIFEVTLTPLGGEAGAGQTALLLRDITARDRMEQELRETTHALRTANEELEKRANTDGLTGLANRRHFMDRMESELDRSLRYGRPLSLVLLDLDHFKAVNDTHGHAAGDQVLRGTADVLRSVSRDVDLPARIGGEELAILLPETAREGAVALAERIRARLEERRYTTDEGKTFGVTGSLGVTTREGAQNVSADAFLHRADTALYRAKDEGRNRVVVDGRSERAAGELREGGDQGA